MLGCFPVVEFCAQRVASKVACQYHTAHLFRRKQRLQHLPNAEMHQCRQQRVPNVVGLCLAFGAGRPIATRCLRGTSCFLGVVGPMTVRPRPTSQDSSCATRVAASSRVGRRKCSTVQPGLVFLREEPRPQFAQLRRSAPWEFAALAAKSIRTLPVDRSTLGAKDDRIVQSSASSIGTSSQLQAGPSECARVEVTVLRKT